MRLFTRRSLALRREEGTFATDRYVTTAKRRRTVVALLAGASVVGWLYVFFGSEIFRVVTVEIHEVRDLERGEVVKEVFASLDERGRWPWSRRNLLLVEADALERDLEKRLYAERVAVEKSYPNVLRLKIRERQSTLVLVSDNELFLLDRRGFVSKRMSVEEEKEILSRIAKPSSKSNNDTPILTVRAMSQVSVPGEPLIDERTVQRWLETFQELSRAGFGYRNAILEYATSTDLILNMYEPYDVHFDLLAPMQPQIQSFFAFTKALAPGTRIYSYVDARIPGRIYYK
ncbi:MAG TPA: hypothetical protein VN397_00545 [Candidatus Methylomirabilis sp.]|nr:hypothetical protein [Candidatus Methylomirabilis sp.]